MEIDIKLYSAIIILAHLVFLGWFIVHRREYFSVRGLFLFVATTWIFGCVAVENGFFAYAPNRVDDCFNYSSLYLMLCVWGTYLISRLTLANPYKLLRQLPPPASRPAQGHSLLPKSVLEFRLAAMLALLLQIFLIVLIVRAGAPLFASNKDAARAALWNDTLPSYFQRIYTIFIPALITLSYLLWAKSCQRKFRPVLLYLNLAGFVLLCVLIVQRSALLQLLIPFVIAVHYANITRLHRNTISVFRQKKVILLALLLVGFMSWGTALYLQRSISEGFQYFCQRLTVGQGESFWKIYYDWIDKEKEQPLSFAGLERFSYVMFRSGILGVADPERDKTDMFEQWVTNKLTSSTYWNTSHYNLVINYLGEGIILFGAYGLVAWTVLGGVMLSLFHRAIRSTFLRGDVYRGVFLVIFFKVQVAAWFNMGGFANIFKVTEMGYYLFLLLLLASFRSLSSLRIYPQHSLPAVSQCP